jgi:ADP-ribose pyrophosphatase
LKPERRVATRQIHRGRALNLRADTVKDTADRETIREVVEHSDCVAVVALDDQDNVLMVRQFRYAVDRLLLEIPAGGIDPGEQPADAVRRELQEEIGYLPRQMERLGGFYAIPGYGTEYLHCYIATDLAPSRLVAEDSESIELVRVPVREIPRLIKSGEVCDAKSIAALLMFLFNR